MATAYIMPHRVSLWSGSAWTVRPDLTAHSGSDGCSNIVGQFTIQANYGQVDVPGSQASPVSTPYDTTPRSQYVRLDLWDGISAWVAFWYGFVTGEERIDQGATMGVVNYQCTGIVGILGRNRCQVGWEMGASGGAALAYLPPFNQCPLGDRSASTHMVRGTTATYIHDRLAQNDKWTARQILDYILWTQVGYFDQATWAYVGTPIVWVIADPDSCLAYVPPALDAQGMSCLDVLNTLASSRRGMAWRTDYNPVTHTATITVRSTSPVSYSTGSYTLPASSLQTAVDLTGVFIDAPRLTWSEDNAADIIEVSGAQPWTTISLVYDTTLTLNMPSLVAGWTSGDLTLWNTMAPNAVKAFNRFVPPSTWDGQQYNTTAAGLTNTLAASGSTDALHGEGGLTGARSYVSTNISPAGCSLVLTRDLPAAAGWINSPRGTRASCEAFVYNGASWICLTPMAAWAECWHLDIEDQPGACAVHIGNGYDDQFRISQYLSASDKLVVTCGVRESSPLRVSWRRAVATWPRSDPRIMTVCLPQYELWTILAGTATAVSSTPATLATYPTTDTVRDDRPHMKAALALLRAFYANPVRSLRWRLKGTIDITAATAPGALVTTATLAGGTDTVNAVITRRSWDFTEDGYGTTYECTPMPPSVEVIR